MSRRYRFSNAASDLTLGGAFTHELLYSAAGTDQISAAPAGTQSGYFASEADDPSVSGATGDYTVVLNVSVAQASTTAAVRLHRVNAAGVIQTSSAYSSEVATDTTGDKTFTFAAQSLGTWAAGDRFAVEVRVTNNGGGAGGPTFDHTDVDARADTPFTFAARVVAIRTDQDARTGTYLGVAVIEQIGEDVA